jgi:hypothetical protein
MLRKRQWAEVVKSPDAYEGKQYVIYGQVTQFDSATEADTFRADTAHKDTTNDGFFDGKAPSSLEMRQTCQTSWRTTFSGRP